MDRINLVDQSCGSWMEESVHVSGGEEINGWTRSVDRSNNKANSE